MNKKELENMKKYNWVYNIMKEQDAIEKYLIGIIALIIGAILSGFIKFDFNSKFGVFLLLIVLFLFILGFGLGVNLIKRANFRNELYLALLSNNLNNIKFDSKKFNVSFRLLVVFIIAYFLTASAISYYIILY